MLFMVEEDLHQKCTEYHGLVSENGIAIQLK